MTGPNDGEFDIAVIVAVPAAGLVAVLLERPLLSVSVVALAKVTLVPLQEIVALGTGVPLRVNCTTSGADGWLTSSGWSLPDTIASVAGGRVPVTTSVNTAPGPWNLSWACTTTAPGVVPSTNWELAMPCALVSTSLLTTRASPAITVKSTGWPDIAMAPWIWIVSGMGRVAPGAPACALPVTICIDVNDAGPKPRPPI